MLFLPVLLSVNAACETQVWCHQIKVIRVTRSKLIIKSYIIVVDLREIVVIKGSRKIAPEENCPPALILTLIVSQTLTLTGGQFSSGLFSGHRH